MTVETVVTVETIVNECMVISDVINTDDVLQMTPFGTAYMCTLTIWSFHKLLKLSTNINTDTVFSELLVVKTCSSRKCTKYPTHKLLHPWLAVRTSRLGLTFDVSDFLHRAKVWRHGLSLSFAIHYCLKVDSRLASRLGVKWDSRLISYPDGKTGRKNPRFFPVWVRD